MATDYGLVSLFGAEFEDELMLANIAGMAKSFKLTIGEAHDILAYAKNGFPPITQTLIEARADDIVSSGEFPAASKTDIVLALMTRYDNISSVFAGSASRNLLQLASSSDNDFEAALSVFRIAHSATVEATCMVCVLKSACPYYDKLRTNTTEIVDGVVSPHPSCPCPPFTFNSFKDALASYEEIDELADAAEENAPTSPTNYASNDDDVVNVGDEERGDVDEGDDPKTQFGRLLIKSALTAEDCTFANQRDRVDFVLNTLKKMSKDKLTVLIMASRFSAVLDEIGDVLNSSNVREEVDRAQVLDLDDVPKARRSELAEDDDTFYAKLAAGDVIKDDPMDRNRKKRLFVVAIDVSSSMRLPVSGGFRAFNSGDKSRVSRIDAASALALAIHGVSWKSSSLVMNCFFGHRPMKLAVATDYARLTAVRSLLLTNDANSGSTEIHGTVRYCFASVKSLAGVHKDIDKAEIILITDGVHNASKPDPNETRGVYAKVAEEVGLHVIGIGDEFRTSNFSKDYGEFCNSCQTVSSLEELYDAVSGGLKTAILDNSRELKREGED